MENKKSFVLYCDLIHTVGKLPDEQAGQLLKIILDYVNDNDPVIEDLLLSVSFEPIRQQLKRDLEKWTEKAPDRKEKARIAGLASAKARQLKSTQSNSLVQNELKPTKSTVSVSVNASVSANEINKKSFDIFWSKYPNKVGKKKVEQKFLKLKPVDIETILSTIDKFIAYKPFESYNHPNPETYINQERWNDETSPVKKYVGAKKPSF